MAMTISEATVCPLVLTLFGPMRGFVQGQPLPHLRSRKAVWLLALLVLRHGRAVERDWLAETLWPDIDPSQALDNLRPILSELRKALGSEAHRLQSPNRHSVLLDLAGAEVDVLIFDAAIASMKLEGLERAVSLYLGPLLEGCTEDWIGPEREAREQDCLRALQTLADKALETRHYQAASDYFRRVVSLDPWQDAARQGLMEALARGGDTNAALQVYREFVTVLRDDPKAAPDPVTSALYARLRAKARQRASVSATAFQAIGEVKTKGNLPHPLTELVGREDECTEVKARLRHSRLVTLTGPGGIGKTRLALAVAAELVSEYADGVWFVALEAITESARVAGQVASVLGLKEESGRTPLERLAEHLSSKRLLLVIDNCEHLMEASARVADHLLRACADVRILATSREALAITGETAWSVPSLAVPDPAHLPSGASTQLRVLMGYESVQLFVERAQAVQQDFALTADNALGVAQVCAYLEGVPLALELAAARIRVLTVAEIAARLPDHLDLLGNGSPATVSRQQTLRATLDWSHALLSVPEQILLRRLSVFVGGWTLEAAEGICRGDGIGEPQILDLLTGLVDKSLVVFEAREAGGRYRLLETIRQYSGSRLRASGQADVLRARHLDWFLALAEEARTNLSGPQQQAWLRCLETEHDNLRSALARCEADSQGAQSGLRLVAALARFWTVCGHMNEGRVALGRALARDGAQAATPARASALKGAGNLAQTQGDHTSARVLLEESFQLFRILGDKQGIADALGDLSNAVNGQGDMVSAKVMMEEALNLFRELGDKTGVARMIGNLSRILRLQGDYASARTLLEESLQIRRDQGDMRGIGWSLSNLGVIAATQGDYASAQSFFEEGLSIRRELGDQRGIATSLGNLGDMASKRGEYALAQALSEEGLALYRELGDRLGTAWGLRDLSDVAILQGRYGAAKGHLKESLHLFAELGNTEGVATALWVFAHVMLSLGDPETAVYLWGAAEALRASIGMALSPDLVDAYDRQLIQARTALGDDGFVTAWESGCALTWEQAVSYALKDARL